MKFGGTSLENAFRVKQAARIVRSFLQDNKIAVVVSAFGETTDWLVQIGDAAQKRESQTVQKLRLRLRSLHLNMAKAVATKDQSRNLARTLETMLSELDRAVEGILNLRELTPRSSDYLMSFGERLSALIFTAALEMYSVRARSFSGAEAGITTDNNFGEARPLIEVSYHQIREKLEPFWAKGEVPVIAGFIAATADGTVTTLGRGGSDYTASLLGAGLSVDEIWIWTDVDGLMTADPRIVRDARVMPKVSFGEALELSYFGAKMMHPRALQPAAQKKIPVRIKNSSKPAGEGTLVSSRETNDNKVVKAVSIIPAVAIVTVSGSGMIGAPGTAGKVFQALGSSKVNVMMISQGSSEATISCVVARKDVNKAIRGLQLSLLGQGQVEKVSAETDVCVIAVVGSGMKGTPGVAARIFSAVARRKVNVRMVAQGSSEYNVSFVVSEKEGPEAVTAIHAEFQLGKDQAG